MVLNKFNKKEKKRKSNYKNNEADLGVCSKLVGREMLDLTTTCYSGRTSETEK